MPDLPEALRAALAADSVTATVFQKLPQTGQREFVEWVNGAKRSETQGRRIKQAMAMLQARRPGR